MTSFPPPVWPPGWYPGPDGPWRWWDGANWGPRYVPPTEEEAGRTIGMVAHLGMFFGGFILPLIIYLTEGNKNRFVRHHAAEALNFQITFTICWLAGMALAFTGFGIAATSDGSGIAVLFIVLWPIMGLLWVGGSLCSILGAVRAWQGRWWRYPIALRLVNGAPG